MSVYGFLFVCFFFFKQKTAYEMLSGDWSSDVCSSDLPLARELRIQLVDALDGLIDAEALGVWPEDLAPSRVELCVFLELPESSGDLDGGLAFLRAHPVQETLNKRIVLEGMLLLSRLAHTGSISPTAG